jgi:hypothetical protein
MNGTASLQAPASHQHTWWSCPAHERCFETCAAANEHLVVSLRRPAGLANAPSRSATTNNNTGSSKASSSRLNATNITNATGPSVKPKKVRGPDPPSMETITQDGTTRHHQRVNTPVNIEREIRDAAIVASYRQSLSAFRATVEHLRDNVSALKQNVSRLTSENAKLRSTVDALASMQWSQAAEAEGRMRQLLDRVVQLERNRWTVQLVLGVVVGAAVLFAAALLLGCCGGHARSRSGVAMRQLLGSPSDTGQNAATPGSAERRVRLGFGAIDSGDFPPDPILETHQQLTPGRHHHHGDATTSMRTPNIQQQRPQQHDQQVVSFNKKQRAAALTRLSSFSFHASAGRLSGGGAATVSDDDEA